MKNLILLFLLSLIISFTIRAQDWVNDKSKLYYISEGGKVYMEPDYSSLAIYFKNVPSETTQEKLETSLSRVKLAEGAEPMTTELMPGKEMMRIFSTQSIDKVQTEADSKGFIKVFGLEQAGAYKVLPSFKIGEKQAWLSKRIIIRLKDNIQQSDIDNILQQYGAKFIKSITNSNTLLLLVEDVDKQLELIQVLNEKGVLVWGEPDFKIEIARQTDPGYKNQWHLNNTGGTIDGKALKEDIDLDAPEAWNITKGSANITVAVIDDGVEAHEDLAPLLKGFTPANNGDGTPYKSNDGHGQSVAGLIAALHNDIGVRGVAPGVKIMSVNIFHPNTTTADIAEGINWAVKNGADVLSNSWGYSTCDQVASTVKDAFDNAAKNGRNGLGCIILVASGNDFRDCVEQ